MNNQKQEIIPQKVIDLAKAIQKAEASNSQLLIIQARQYGKKAAYALAQGNQIIPADQPSDNPMPKINPKP